MIFAAIGFNVVAADWTDEVNSLDTKEAKNLKDFSESMMREIMKIDKVYLLVSNQDAGSIDYLHVYEEYGAD